MPALEARAESSLVLEVVAANAESNNASHGFAVAARPAFSAVDLAKADSTAWWDVLKGRGDPAARVSKGDGSAAVSAALPEPERFLEAGRCPRW